MTTSQPSQADLQPCSVCGELASHPLHLDDPHGWENMASPLDCNYEASYEGEETGWVGTCDHHEFEPGDDADKRAVMFDGAYDRYMDEQIDRANTAP